MKKFFCMVVALCMVFASTVALAADQPFVSGVSYGEKFDEYGAVPSMLNFGSAGKLSPGESLYDVKTSTIKKIKASTLVNGLADNTYYCYAKWQFAYSFSSYTVNAMLVMTTPSDEYYATYDTWEMTDFSPKMICSWFFDVTDILQRCADDHKGVLEKGEYSFSMFFNDMSFRVTKLRLS